MPRSESFRGVLGPKRRPGIGQALSEFALFSPILILFLLGAGSLALAFQANVAVSNAAREGARHAVHSVGGTNPDLNNEAVLQAVRGELQAEVVGGVDVQAAPSGENGCPKAPYAPSAYPPDAGKAYLYVCYNDTPGATSAQPGQPLRVTLLESFGLPVPVLNQAQISLSADATMMVQGV